MDVGFRLQKAIVVPYIQQALDEQCGQGNFQAREGEFYQDSGYHWRDNTNSAQCYLNGKSWSCSCPSR